MFGKVHVGLTDAGCDGGAALLVALCAAVACDAGHSILTGALACGLVTRLSRCSDRMAITRYGEKRKIYIKTGCGHVNDLNDKTSLECEMIRITAGCADHLTRIKVIL